MKKLVILIAIALFIAPILAEAKPPSDIPQGYTKPVKRVIVPRVVCGDGVKSELEQCDTTAQPPGNQCKRLTQACVPPGAAGECKCKEQLAHCGDNLVNTSGETCDGQAGASTCFDLGNQCRTAGLEGECTCCGDGVVNPGEKCDPAITPDVCAWGDTCNPSTCKCGSSKPPPAPEKLHKRPVRIK